MKNPEIKENILFQLEMFNLVVHFNIGDNPWRIIKK